MFSLPRIRFHNHSKLVLPEQTQTQTNENWKSSEECGIQNTGTLPSAVDVEELYELLKDEQLKSWVWYLQSKHQIHMENDTSWAWGDSERSGMLLLKCYSSMKRQMPERVIY